MFEIAMYEAYYVIYYCKKCPASDETASEQDENEFPIDIDQSCKNIPEIHFIVLIF